MKVLKIVALSIITLITSIYILTRLIVPAYLDKDMNKVFAGAPYKVSNEAQLLYDSIDFVSDLHCDVLLWDRDILEEHDHGHVDVPRMINANMALQAFTIVSKTPRNMNFDNNDDKTDNVTLLSIVQGRPWNALVSLKYRALVQANSLFEFAEESEGKFRVITSATELQKFIEDRKDNQEITAGFLGAEGAQILEGNIEYIDDIYNAGLRMVGPVHFFDNEVGGSAHGINKGGLTEFGRRAIKKMQNKKMIIDLSHASPRLVDDILSISTQPLIVSHTGVKGTCNNVRNLSDRHLQEIANGGGLIGIAMFEQAVCGNDAKATAKSIRYTVDLVGLQYVALGSDFDGAVLAHFDVTGLPLIVDALLDEGFNAREIAMIMGGNVKTFLLKNLPA